MKYIIDHDLHIHSKLSFCSQDENQTASTILNYAKKYNLKSVCVTDHYFDRQVIGASDWYLKQDYNHISKILPLPKDDKVNFMFGCETEFNKELTIGIPPSRYNDFSFIIIPTTHFHMTGYTIPESAKDSVSEKAKLWVSKLNALLNMNLPFEKIGVPHLAADLIFFKDVERYKQVLESISDTDMEEVFTKCAKLGVGIEINSCDFKYSDYEKNAVLRVFKIAKSCGCNFFLDSVAHHPKNLDGAIELFNRAINDIGLTENDKYDFERLYK